MIILILKSFACDFMKDQGFYPYYSRAKIEFENEIKN